CTKVLRRRDDVLRKHAIFDDGLRVIDIVDEVIECGDALFEPRRDPVPLFRGNDARDDGERPGAVDRTVFLVIHGERDAHDLDCEFRGLLAYADLCAAKLREMSNTRTACDAGAAAR